jgi:hypothetical protein
MPKKYMQVGVAHLIDSAGFAIDNADISAGSFAGLVDGSSAQIFEAEKDATDANAQIDFVTSARPDVVLLVNVNFPEGRSVRLFGSGYEQTAQVYADAAGKHHVVFVLPSGANSDVWSIELIGPGDGIRDGTGTVYKIGQLVAMTCEEVRVQPSFTRGSRGGLDTQYAESGRPSVVFTPMARIETVNTTPVKDYFWLEQLRGKLARIPFTAIVLDPTNPTETAMMCTASNLGDIRSFGDQRYSTMSLGFTEIVSIFGGGGDSWPEAMLSSYRLRNPEQAAWFDEGAAGAEAEAELLSRLSRGYLYATFGPKGQNRSACDFVYLLSFTNDIIPRGVAKTGEALRWDIDGTIYAQNDFDFHEIGSGKGIATVSSTDIWAGLTSFQIHVNSFRGGIPRIANHTAVEVFNCQSTDMTGALPRVSDNVSLGNADFSSCKLSGWSGGTVSASLDQFYAHNQESPGTGLSQANVDGILAAFDAAGRNTGTRVLHLGGTNNAVPSAAGLTSKSNLEAKGWTVTVNS